MPLDSFSDKLEIKPIDKLDENGLGLGLALLVHNC